MNRFWMSMGVLVVCVFVMVKPGTAQEIVPVFPQANQTITLLDLLNGGLGFQWDDPVGANNYTIQFENPGNLILQLQSFPIENIQSSPYFLAETFRGRFLSGNYFWTIRTQDGSRSSARIPFFINSTGIRPTPGPDPEPPSGDINGSAFIDKTDIYLLAANWKQEFFDSFAADFNVDGSVNQEDLLTLASRFGSAAVPPTSVPPGTIGKPGNITFLPNDVIGFPELANFRITWEPPQSPDSEFFYKIIIISQFGQEIVSMRYLQNTEFSLSSLTQDGTYDFHIRAKVADGSVSDIVSAQFTIDPTRQVTPTPNRGTINLDYNNDGSVNADDSRLFIQAFGAFNGDPNFISGADFNQDGFIDSLDLATYQNSYPSSSAVPAAPAWSSIVRPIMQIGAFSQCQNSGGSQTIGLPPNDVVFENSQCIFAELFSTQFFFEPAGGALDYFYSIRFEDEVDPVLEGFTLGENFFSGFSVLQRDATFIFEIQAVNEALQFSEVGEPLRFTIPAAG